MELDKNYNPINPVGGTELMFNELQKRLPNHMMKYSIFNYPQQAEEGYPWLYWNQLSYDQSLVSSLKDTNFIKKLNKIIFVSNWQAEMFRKIFNIPTIKTEVIKNACIGVPEKKITSFKDKEKIKICYTSTPWRGLDVLLRAWELNRPENCELHIFSSTKIYGKEYAESEDYKFNILYKKARTLPDVVYRGSIENEKLRNELVEFDILAYPSTFEETSCISVIDALSAGLRVITSNIGALPETCEGWARIYPYKQEKEIHSEYFSKILNEEVLKLRNDELNIHLNEQMLIYKKRWSWEQREKDWRYFFENNK
jgi:glycosyltransferase involved in cell wall biosynthesis